MTAKLREMGARVEIGENHVRVWRRQLQAVKIKTQPHPGFPTDMQPQIVAALALAKGTSIVSETVFPSRFKYVDELRRMGADIAIVGNVAVIREPRCFPAAQTGSDRSSGWRGAGFGGIGGRRHNIDCRFASYRSWI